jgi:hypothetical protein
MTVRYWADPAAEPVVAEVTSHRQMILGGRYMAEKVTGMVMGQPFEGSSLTGYDNVKGKYWSVWVDSQSTWPQMTEGVRDEAGSLVMLGSVSNPAVGRTTQIKTVWSTVGRDKETFVTWEDRGSGMVKLSEIDAVRQ